jgi:DNA-binding response OmpR family regulator
MNPAEHPFLVLLVEDSDDDAFFFHLALRKTGVNCRVIHLSDGKQAAEYLDALHSGSGVAHPDLVFLDLKLPLLNGFEILEWIRGRTYDPPLRISILSGSDHEADMERARKLGAGDYLVKPISSDQLIARMSPLISIVPMEKAPLNPQASSTPSSASFQG